MKPVPECIPDALDLVLRTARLVSDDGFIHRKVLSKVMGELAEDPSFDATPAELTFQCLLSAYKALGVRDPYEKEKARRNKAMQGLEPSFRSYLDVAPDRLSACLNLVIAGYIGGDVLGRAEAERDILEHLDSPLARDDRAALVKELARAGSVLYITDTAGEIVLDKLLIEELGKKRPVTAVVAHRPVLTAATREDAEAVGLIEAATVVDPGASMLGLILEKASREFRELFKAADLVIAKGQTNFETLSGTDREAFFLFQATDETVAGRLDVPPGSGLLLHRAGRPGTAVLEAVGDRARPGNAEA